MDVAARAVAGWKSSVLEARTVCRRGEQTLQQATDDSEKGRT